MLRALLAILIVVSPDVAKAEIVRPTHFGDWRLACSAGINGPATCSVYLRTEGIKAYNGRVRSSGLSVSIDLEGGQTYFVRSFGSNVETCGALQIDERMLFIRHPRYFDEYLAELQGRLLRTMRSHLKLLGRCSLADQPLGGFPEDLFEASIPDLKSAVAVMAQSVRQRQPRNFSPDRPRQ